MSLMTKEEYLSGLRALAHTVYLQGEQIQSVVDHPVSAPAAMAMAETYHQGEKPEMRELFTAESPPSSANPSTASPTSTRAPMT